MSVFTLIYPGQAANSAMTGSVEALALLMLGLGLAGIVLTLLNVMKPKGLRAQTSESRTERAQHESYLHKLAK